MTNGMTKTENVRLIGENSITMTLGIMALGFYWAWIFSCFSSDVMNPFGQERILDYQLLLVMAAGISALSMGISSIMPAKAESFLRSTPGSVLVALLATLAGIPSLATQLGCTLSFPLVTLLWCAGMFVSTFVYLKTAPFLVWLRRIKLSRCIGLSFLAAAIGYLLAQVLVPIAGVSAVMLYPAASVACSQRCESHMGKETDPSQAASKSRPLPQRDKLGARVRELVRYAPSTLVYSLSFGFVSAIALMLAVREDLILIVASAILLSAMFTTAYSFTSRAQLDATRFRRFLLPLIAIALLPFPYLPTVFKIAFLAVAVFGFTCFDALGWGDLADEVRDRNLEMFSYLSTAQSVGFIGIFIGWLIGWVVCREFGSNVSEPFGIISAVLVIFLILEVVIGDEADADEAKPPASEFIDSWEDSCKEVAQRYSLTKQETNIFVMLARGRNLKYIADELCISGHTVKTHIYHIYRKLDIHSQQDLIDLVESVSASTESDKTPRQHSVR